MTTLIAARPKHVLVNGLLLFVALSFMLIWLPFLRALFDGQSYSWGMSYFGYVLHGEGLNAHYLFLIVQLIFYALLFTSVYWTKNRPVAFVLLGLWWLQVFGNLLFDIMKNGDTMFHGDTLNVHVSLSSVAVPLGVLALILIAWFIRSDVNGSSAGVQWSKLNTRLALIVFTPLPIQALFFATGEPHGITDQVAVIISILQCFAIPFIIQPFGAKNQQ